ncbi:MAG: DUF1573 domain-containing protein [Bacteroidota bacterium]|jgi:hypothetical protein
MHPTSAIAKLKRIATAALLMFLLSAAPKASAQTQQEGITVLGTDTIYCTETLLKGDTVMAIFHVANYGTQAFKILQVYAACQCTAPQYAQDTFQPGRVDSVVLFFHSKNIQEPSFEKYALILTPLGEKYLYLKGTIFTPGPADKVRQPKCTIIHNR